MADELLWGVKNGDLDAVKKSCEKAGFDVNAELLNGRNLLHYAADYGQVEVIKYLLTKGAEIDLPDKHGITALLAAIFEGHTECVQLLISKGANKEGKSADGTAYRDCAETDEIKDLLK